MKLLLDPHLQIWAAMGEALLPTEALGLMSDRANELVFSAASIWEIAIKKSQGRPGFQIDPHLMRANLVDSGYVELAVNADHAAAVADLPNIHRDPFDRILLAQAITEGVLLLTADARLAQYPGPVRLTRR